MNFDNIYDEVEARRPLNLMSSFPVIRKDGDQLEVMWYYFMYEQTGGIGDVQVTGICTTKDGEDITEMKADLREKANWVEEDEPKMDETEYYEQLEQLYQAYDEELMASLLRSAEQAAFLKAYETVALYLRNKVEDDLIL